MVTEFTRKKSFLTIKTVAEAILSGEHFLSYSELACRIDMPNKTGQGLGPILDDAAIQCRKHELPDVSANVVTKGSLEAGKPFPSDDSFNSEGIWPITGLHKSEVKAEQQRVIKYNWASLRELGLGPS